MTRLLYFADPMCSWCWGFAPVIARLLEEHGSRLQLELVMGGLRAGETRPMTPSMREEILQHWHHVEEASGQPFDFVRGLPAGFVYDTEPACRAVVTVRTQAPQTALSYLHAVQAAFYAEARDVTAAGELAALAAKLGLDAERFRREFESPSARERVQQDFERTREHGVPGFPCVFLEQGGRRQIITIGYRSYPAVLELLQRREALAPVA